MRSLDGNANSICTIEALEFLLVPDSSEGELAFKFRMRGTLLFSVGKSIEEKERVYELLRDVYDLRSAGAWEPKTNRKTHRKKKQVGRYN